jgi:hypothetical protein
LKAVSFLGHLHIEKCDASEKLHVAVSSSFMDPESVVSIAFLE